ncbi:hypothetical protein DOY81_014389, partial [Sarcophaga bullata]
KRPTRTGAIRTVVFRCKLSTQLVLKRLRLNVRERVWIYVCESETEPVVIVDDLSQQKPTVNKTESNVKKEEETESKTANVTVTTKTKKPVFIGVPVLPPTVPLTELQNLKKKETKTKVMDLKEKETKEETKIIEEEKPKAENLKKESESEDSELKEMERVVQTNEKETVKTASEEHNENKTEVKETSEEVKTETKQTTTKTGSSSCTTTTKKIIKSSTTSSTSSTVLASKTCDNLLDALEDLPEEFKKVLSDTKSPDSPKTINFSLQPYTERMGNTKITVLEERQFESDQKAYAEIRTRDRDTGEEKIQKSCETHKEKAKLKKLHSQDQLDDKALLQQQQQQPITVTAQAETRLSEEALSPQDNQSISRGILNLSECGKQLKANDLGGVDLIECEHQIVDTFEDSEQLLTANSKDNEKPQEKPSLLREITETLTVSRDGEKQVTKRSELSKEQPDLLPQNFSDIDVDNVLQMQAQKLITDETQQLIDTVLKDAENKVNKKMDSTAKESPKKGAKLVKKTEEEKKLELEAQKLIESYQKVKKEAEKLFQYESRAFAEDDKGFDLGHVVESPSEEVKQVEEIKTEPIIITPSSSEDFIDNEPVYVLHKNIIEPKETVPREVQVTQVIATPKEEVKPASKEEKFVKESVRFEQPVKREIEQFSETTIPTETGKENLGIETPIEQKLKNETVDLNAEIKTPELARTTPKELETANFVKISTESKSGEENETNSRVPQKKLEILATNTNSETPIETKVSENPKTNQEMKLETSKPTRTVENREKLKEPKSVAENKSAEQIKTVSEKPETPKTTKKVAEPKASEIFETPAVLKASSTVEENKSSIPLEGNTTSDIVEVKQPMGHNEFKASNTAETKKPPLVEIKSSDIVEAKKPANSS